MKVRSILLALVLLVAGCASAPAPRESATLLHDALFAAPSKVVSSDAVFALTPAMRDFLDREIPLIAPYRNPRMALVNALNDRVQLKLDYDATRTRDAGESFAERSGNCLSLVVMTSALARELGIDVRYQVVFTEDTWSRRGDTYLFVGHVNLSLGNSRLDRDNERLTIDFVPPSTIRGARVLAVSEATVIAMFMNNRAVESFLEGRIDDAYWYAREAIMQDPRYLAAVNTLGVVYRLHGHRKEAESAFAEVLRREPGNTMAMTNLVPLLRDLGRTAEADAIERKLAEVEPFPPFHFYERGIAAMRRGDFEVAKAMFTREVERASYYHEFHFWLAIALFQLGEAKQARRHLDIAIESSPDGADHELYVAKLAWMRQASRVQ